MTRAAITSTGSYIPEVIIKNKTFLSAQFFEPDGTKMYRHNKSIIEKFKTITGISERRYARTDQQASDLAFLASVDALTSGSVDKETLDYIIVAHNFGDVANDSNRVNMVPAIASRVKALLEIQNPDCIAYDLPFGCPGWVQALIQANYYLLSGDARRCLVIGAETLSRVIDPHDRDSMIFSDGSGAVIVDAIEGDSGVISHKTQSHAIQYSDLLNMGPSHSPYVETKQDLFIKMNGRKVYEFALQHVPLVIKNALDKAGLVIDDVAKVLIHQANEKMDSAILERLLKLYGKKNFSNALMPMTIGWLGNSSVATVPTLLDLLMKGRLPGHIVQRGDVIVLASVGAGMNINAVVYRV